MDGPHITLMVPPILPDPLTGMRRGGMRGIRNILITGIIFIAIIPIGAGINMVVIMMNIFIIRTIVAKAEVGIKDSMIKSIIEPTRMDAAKEEYG